MGRLKGPQSVVVLCSGEAGEHVLMGPLQPSPQCPLRRALKVLAYVALGVLLASQLLPGQSPFLPQPLQATQLRLRDSYQHGRHHKDSCEKYLGISLHGPISVIFTADPGDFSGIPEAHYIIANLRDKRSKPHSQTVCGLHYYGILMGQPVLVVTTGIGPPAAGLCTLEVVSACGQYIQDIMYFGTSGWSPQLGGVLNPPQCSAANNNGLITRLGDVCVSPFTVNWTCKKSSWSQQAGGYPNQCYKPPEAASPNATILYGECQFYKDNMKANMELADEVLRAANSHASLKHMPQRSSAVSMLEQRYWSLMGNATGVNYPLPQAESAPTFWDYTQCMETDGQFFYSGVPFEVKARDYAAETLTAALGVTKTSADVIAVSAMEGIGVAEALLKYHALSTTVRPIPYTHVRTLSNWLHQPVKQVKPGVWQQAGEIPEDFVTGYGYAIATGSATILSVYHTRCKRDVNSQRLPDDNDCSYFVDYGSMQQGAMGQSDQGSHSSSSDSSSSSYTQLKVQGTLLKQAKATTAAQQEAGADDISGHLVQTGLLQRKGLISSAIAAHSQTTTQ